MVEGATHTAKRSMINCVSRGAPAPVYEGARGGSAGQGERRTRRSPTPTGSRTPSLFLVGLGVEGERGGREGGKGGAAPLSLSYSDRGRGVRPCPGLLSSLPPVGP